MSQAEQTKELSQKEESNKKQISGIQPFTSIIIFIICLIDELLLTIPKLDYIVIFI